MQNSDVRWFRIVAVAEAISWAGLIIGMVFKYVVVHNPIGVHIFGSVHGVLFLAYVGLAVRWWRNRPWPTRVGVWAMVGAVVPFDSVVFERWATRHGHLESRSDTPVG